MRLSWRAFFDHKRSIGRILSKPTFDFDVQSLRSIIQKNPWPRIIDIGPAICKLLRFLQVQSEHERTLVLKVVYYINLVCMYHALADKGGLMEDLKWLLKMTAYP